jgi:hypothetical protein
VYVRLKSECVVTRTFFSSPISCNAVMKAPTLESKSDKKLLCAPKCFGFVTIGIAIGADRVSKSSGMVLCESHCASVFVMLAAGPLLGRWRARVWLQKNKSKTPYDFPSLADSVKRPYMTVRD